MGGFYLDLSVSPEGTRGLPFTATPQPQNRSWHLEVALLEGNKLQAPPLSQLLILNVQYPPPYPQHPLPSSQLLSTKLKPFWKDLYLSQNVPNQSAGIPSASGTQWGAAHI